MKGRMAVMVLILFWVTGCATAPSNNPFLISEKDFFAESRPFVLVPVGMPRWADETDPVKRKFESLITGKLQGAQFEVLPTTVYGEIWDGMTTRMGGYYDRISGKRDEKKFDAVMEHTLRELHRKVGEVLVLHPNLEVVHAMLSYGGATWDGTREEFQTYGFKGTIRALSLCIAVEDTNRKILYHRHGGIQLLETLSWSGVPIPLPSREILSRDELLVRAVNIAMGPLVQRSVTK